MTLGLYEVRGRLESQRGASQRRSVVYKSRLGLCIDSQAVVWEL